MCDVFPYSPCRHACQCSRSPDNWQTRSCRIQLPYPSLLYIPNVYCVYYVIVIAEKLRLNGHSLPFFSSVHRIQGSHGLHALNRRDVDSFHFHHISFSPHRIQLLIATQKYAPHPSLRLARATLLVIDRLTDHNSATSHKIL